jgi:hypothetical protein
MRGEEKGFCYVVLQGMVDFSSEYAQHRDRLHVLKDDKGDRT